MTQGKIATSPSAPRNDSFFVIARRIFNRRGDLSESWRGTPHPALSPCLGRGEIYDRCCFPCMGRGDLDGQHYFLSMGRGNLDDQCNFPCMERGKMGARLLAMYKERGDGQSKLLPQYGQGEMIGKRPNYREMQTRNPIMQRNRQQNLMLFTLTLSRRAARQQSIQLQDPRPHLWGRGRGEGVSLSQLTIGMNNDGGGI